MCNLKDKKPMHHGASATIFARARILRAKATPAEKKLWEALKGKKLGGVRFRRQHPIGRYILDFYCHSSKLGIELDGAYHQDKLQQWSDADRTLFLEDLGLRIIRFTNEEVLENLSVVLSTIEEKLNQ